MINAETPVAAPPDSRFFIREISWVDFNERVLEEGLREDLLPLDRFRFLSIVSSNFDEFFMVRAAALKQALKNSGSPDPGSQETLKTVSRKVRSIHQRQYSTLKNDIFPGCAQGGLCLLDPVAWSSGEHEYFESLFLQEILPVLTPLRVNDEEPLPLIENLCIHAAFLLESETENSGGISVIRVPPVLDRIIRIPQDKTEGKLNGKEKFSWVLLEDLILKFGRHLYPGYRIKEQLLFTITRDADFSVDEQRDEDFIEAMEEVLEGREHSMVIRMLYSRGSPGLRDYFASRFGLEEDDLYEIDGPLSLRSLFDLTRIPGFDHLREKPWKIYPHPGFPEDGPLWDRIREGDVLLHVPYQSFDPVLRFFRDAASDPQVISIKTTLYRTSNDSPVIRALELAGLSGKHVTAIVELKARFDERQNISWANRLEKAGVIVVYGLARLKIHVKSTVVIRKENSRLRRYVHLSTGNYNDKTAKLYEDLSLFTAREDIAYDAGLLFNMITGYSATQPMRRLVIAPEALKKKLLFLIKREADNSRPEAPGRIMAKMNALADPDIIEALYRASRAGVEVLLNVRGICLLVPGVPGMSENIRVVSIIDHYLEHSRICYFSGNGINELYLSSADWMPRNLERRVEIMFPVLEEDIKNQVLNILKSYFKDNTHAWNLGPDGVWTRVQNTGEPYRVQTRFLGMAEKAAKIGSAKRAGDVHKGFVVRRSPPAAT